MNCPRCKSAIDTPVNPDGIITCPGCGARLMTRAAARRTGGGPRSNPGAADAATSPVLRTAPPIAPADHPPEEHAPEDHPPDVTAPAGLSFQVRVGAPAAVGEEPETDAHAEAHHEPEHHEVHREPAGRGEIITLATIRQEIVALQATQQKMLDLLTQLTGGGGGAEAAGGQGDPDSSGPILSPVRTQKRKSVLLVDDDGNTRDAAKQALEQADVPVRAITSGQAAMREIADDKPDVIAIELGLAGEMAGKDVINMIKATMEWVDIPIVLWTREAVETQKEARQIHGADEIVKKSSGAEALVACVISLFRRA